MLLGVFATNNHVLTHFMQPMLLIHFLLHKEAFSIKCSQFWVHSSRSLILVQPHSFTFWLSRTPFSTRWSARSGPGAARRRWGGARYTRSLEFSKGEPFFFVLNIFYWFCFRWDANLTYFVGYYNLLYSCPSQTNANTKILYSLCSRRTAKCIPLVALSSTQDY